MKPKEIATPDLTPAAFLHAVYVGANRRAWSLLRRRAGRYGINAKEIDAWEIDVEGALAEALVAKLTGTPFVGAIDERDRGGDAGPFGVRWTSHETGCLLLHPEDDDDRLFFLVTGRWPAMRVAGAILARDGKREKWWRETAPGRTAFWVPQSALVKEGW